MKKKKNEVRVMAGVWVVTLGLLFLGGKVKWVRVLIKRETVVASERECS
jgi:hypothetical protein